MVHSPKEINITEYSYDLPESRIAKYPPAVRDSSKLLVYKNKKTCGELSRTIQSACFYDLPAFLESGQLLVFNDTKVIQARLYFEKPTGAKIEIFCVAPDLPADYSLAFSKKTPCRWKCLIGNSRKWKENSISRIFLVSGKKYKLSAKKILNTHEFCIIEFSWEHEELTFGALLELLGVTPIPPYLNRRAESSDKQNYQTIYSNYDGSVAAPTAGLHFTQNTMKALEDRQIKTSMITLHIGTGTFKPVTSAKIGDHTMHTEYYSISKESLQQIISHVNNIIATGTTTVRTMESLYLIGVKIVSGKQNNIFHTEQWEVYETINDISPEHALTALLSYMQKNDMQIFSASTALMIVPGYKFRLIKGMLTNFHLPKSTLLLLVAAFIGDDWKKVYNFALANDYRFLSYGDCSLLIPGIRKVYPVL
ncbi:MAG: S-adenosylmethionine:tRNA ribosyltransferase-isomerase [Bacteroidia bacterium]|nr:S-adenosylmethionine:tRNA ribosyltransferase-isomerase [Bacteroidia bacterium]